MTGVARLLAASTPRPAAENQRARPSLLPSGEYMAEQFGSACKRELDYAFVASRSFQPAARPETFFYEPWGSTDNCHAVVMQGQTMISFGSSR